MFNSWDIRWVMAELEVGVPGPLAGDIGPERDWPDPAGEAAGEGEGPLRMLERRGEVCGENGDWAWLLCSP